MQRKEYPNISSRALARMILHEFKVHRNTSQRWLSSSPQTYEKWEVLARKKNGKVLLPEHCQNMSKSRIRGADLEDLAILDYEDRRFNLKLAVNFK